MFILNAEEKRWLHKREYARNILLNQKEDKTGGRACEALSKRPQQHIHTPYRSLAASKSLLRRAVPSDGESRITKRYSLEGLNGR